MKTFQIKIVKKYLYKGSPLYTLDGQNITSWQYQQFKDSPKWQIKKVITTFFKKSHKTIEIYEIYP